MWADDDGSPRCGVISNTSMRAKKPRASVMSTAQQVKGTDIAINNSINSQGVGSPEAIEGVGIPGAIEIPILGNTCRAHFQVRWYGSQI
jgi:hypothetical protein